MKCTQLGKKEVKLSWFADDRILCVENPNDRWEWLELINELTKVEEYKINI